MSTNFLNIEEIEGGFKIISITRPEALNALNSDVLNELNATFESFLGEESGTNGVLITGQTSFMPVKMLYLVFQR